MHEWFEKKNVGAVANIEWNSYQSEEQCGPGFGREIQGFKVLFGVDQCEDEAEGSCEKDVGQDFFGHFQGLDEGVAIQYWVAIGDASFVIANAVQLQYFGGIFNNQAGDDGGKEGKDDAQNSIFHTEHGKGDGNDVWVQQGSGDNEGDDDFEGGFALHGFHQGDDAAGADGEDGAVQEGKKLVFRVESFDFEKILFQEDAGQYPKDDDNEKFEKAFVELEKPFGDVFVNNAGIVAQGGEAHHVHVEGMDYDENQDGKDEKAGVALVFGGLQGFFGSSLKVGGWIGLLYLGLNIGSFFSWINVFGLGFIWSGIGHGCLVGENGERFLMKQVFLIHFAKDGEFGGFLLNGNDFEGQVLLKLGFGQLFPSGLILDFEA